jgi:hypothetical protein
MKHAPARVQIDPHKAWWIVLRAMDTVFGEDATVIGVGPRLPLWVLCQPPHKS